MGLMTIFHRLYVNLVVIPMRSDPFDEHDLMTIVDRYHQPAIIPFDIEGHSVRSHNAGIRIGLQNIRLDFPVSANGLMKPGLKH
jgi:hypothetical protein